MSSLRRALSLFAAVWLLFVGLVPPAQAGLLTGYKICLDPGHGGADPGAVNGSLGLRESDINLDVSYGLKALLEEAGATVVMTRTGNEARTESERAAFCSRAEATVLVSVHTNSVADAGPNGVLMLYAKPDDIPLAQAIYDALVPVLSASAPDPASFIHFGVRRYRAAVMRRSTIPAALVEPVFLSNPAEAALLMQPIYTAAGFGKVAAGCVGFSCRRGQIARGIYDGILRYFEGMP